MKQIILSLTIGLVVGYGVTSVFENSEISQLQVENNNAKLQMVKLTEQLLILQKQNRPSPHIAQRQVVKRSTKNLTSNSLHKAKRKKQSQEQMYAQRRQATEHMRSQQSNNGLKDHQVKTTENGTVL
ncbi:hypothetical protein [Colwellia piezophila]|uniref:hypothetical protein n=1 Tax=Colwellia piezophila TaxID=211668 RepID=UPI0003771D2C|nr:hypothetical protein [Colwellia piezophila]